MSRLEKMLARTIGYLKSSDELLDQLRPRVVVVASQHAVAIRALLHVARQRGVATAYVPHGPFANNRSYADLPVDLALLRGQREIEAYVKLGADPARMAVIGNTMLKNDPSIGIAPRSYRPVIAPSPWPSERVTQFLEIALSVPERAVICPHPRSDHAVIETFAARFGATIAKERTSDYLMREGGVVIQSSSGVALEAMLLGVPVIDVQLNSGAPNYPCIAEPYVARVSDSQSLAVAYHAAASTAHNNIDAARRWALEWSNPNGPAAIDNLKLALSDVCPQPHAVLDGWAHGDRRAR